MDVFFLAILFSFRVQTSFPNLQLFELLKLKLKKNSILN